MIALKVLMFHHAGGSGISYASLARDLPPDCEPVLFELAGRGMREDEPFASGYTAAVDDLLPAAIEAVDGPAVLFGHSLGGLLAHSVACTLPPPQRSLVREVVISSAYPPSYASAQARHPVEPFQVRSRAELLAELQGRGGCPPEMLEDPDFVEYALTILGHDLHLADTYVPPGGSSEADFEVWYGVDDPYYGAEYAHAWVDALPGAAKVREFRGGHFYLTQTVEPGVAFCDLVREI